MRKFLGTIVLLAAVLIGVGWMRGWFDISTQSADDKTNIEFRIDKEKIKQDAEAAKEKAREIASPSGEDAGSSIDDIILPDTPSN